MEVLSNITVDLVKPGLTPVIEAVQGDTARVVCLTLLANGKDWILPYDVEVLVRYRNEYGRGGVFDTLPDGVTVFEMSRNMIRIALPPQVFGVPGRTKVQAVLLQGGKQLTVFAFEVLCQGTYAGEPGEEYVNISNWLTQHGMKPIKGVDYWNAEDIADMHSYIDAQLGVIENGTY